MKKRHMSHDRKKSIQLPSSPLLQLLPSKRNIIFIIIFIANNTLFYNYYLPKHDYFSSTNNNKYDSNVDHDHDKTIKNVNYLKKDDYYLHSLKMCLNNNNGNSVNTTSWSSNNSNNHNEICKKFWNGDSLTLTTNNNNNIKYNVSVIISYCNEDMNIIKNYINDNNNMNMNMNILIITRCPISTTMTTTTITQKSIDKVFDNNHGNIIIKSSIINHDYPDYNFLEWILEYASSTTNDKNHILFFINSHTIIQNNNNIRTMNEVIQSSTNYGFGCVIKPKSNEYSIYHDTTILRTFSHPSSSSNNRDYANYGDWLDKLNISSLLFGRKNEREIVPVCYGSSFAINAKNLIDNKQKIYKIIKPLITELHTYSNKNNNELSEFVERTWAMILSDPLRKDEILFLNEYSTSVFKASNSYTGSLKYSSITKSHLFHLWKGTTAISTTATKLPSINYQGKQLRYTLVISYCNEDMSWMESVFNNDIIQLQDVIIYSKCNNHDNIKGYTLTNQPKIISLPNVGRCDHSYAYFMSQLNDDYNANNNINHNNDNSNNNDNHIIFFITASRDRTPLEYRSIQNMIKITIQNGFGCAMEHDDPTISIYHDTNIMKQHFALSSWKGMNIKSQYKNMGYWLRALGIEELLPNHIPVCYGGNFASLASQIIKYNVEGNNIWNGLDRTLMRGDNIEEGHFVERIWAGLLSFPLTNEQIHLLQSIPSHPMYGNGFPYPGILKYDESR